MLEKMREPGAPLGLRPDANVIDDRHSHHRGAAIGGKDDAKAVGKGEPLDRRSGVLRT
jgi:hypothetical protein